MLDWTLCHNVVVAGIALTTVGQLFLTFGVGVGWRWLLLLILSSSISTATIKSLLAVLALLQQKPWRECCAQCKWW